MTENKGRYPWYDSKEMDEMVKSLMTPEENGDAWWAKMLSVGGFNTVEEYQNDIFPKYGTMFAITPITKKNVRVLGWISQEVKKEQPRPTELEMQCLAIYAMILVDADKHHLDWQKAADDMDIHLIVDKYIRRH